jgi:RNA 2',3'-cyclic 3'-phosphodiesterase
LKIRLFLAAELPREAVDALVGWRPRGDALRLLAPEALHVTLAFLGWRGEEDVAPLSAVVEASARPVAQLSLGEALWLPRRRPRVLAVGLDDGDGALGAVQSEVARALQEAVGWTPERRAFLAHVTVARVRGGGRLPDAGTPPRLGPFAASALTLFRSHLSSGGARYEALARASLAP